MKEHYGTAVLDPTSLLEIDASKPLMPQLAAQIPNIHLSAKGAMEVLEGMAAGGLEKMHAQASGMTISSLGGYLYTEPDDCILAVATIAMLEAIPSDGSAITVPDRIQRAMRILSDRLQADW